MKRVKLLLCFFIVIATVDISFSQTDEARILSPNNNLWLGSYYKFRLSEKWFWRAEFHYRTIGTEQTPFVGQLAQIYNRHAISYIFSPNFNVALGAVFRLDFSPDPNDSDLTPMILEPRIWHEYMFVMPLSNMQLFHRIRIEHRWNTSFSVDSQWIFRNRWRYKIYANIPLNKKTLSPGALTFNPEAELIMQSGKNVVNSPMEDLRLAPTIGYIASPHVSYSAGLMYTLGQNLNDGSVFRQRWILRFNAYISLDFRKQRTMIPSIRFTD